MEQYPVPQFIEQEGKIIFFLSFSQFFYLIGGGAFAFLFYYILPFGLFIVTGPVALIISAVLAFVKVNGMTVLELMMSTLGFAVGGKNYVWKKRESPYPFRPMKRTEIRKIDQGPVLQAQQSQLKKIKTAVEMKTK